MTVEAPKTRLSGLAVAVAQHRAAEPQAVAQAEQAAPPAHGDAAADQEDEPVAVEEADATAEVPAAG